MIKLAEPKSNIMILSKEFICLMLIAAGSFYAKAQCTVTTEMNANGTISKATEAQVIYNNERYTMLSQIKHDGIDYYFVWVVKPIVNESVKSASMEIVFDNENTVKLDFYDSYRERKDSSISALFRVPPEHVEILSSHPINHIRINTSEGPKNFILKLHKELVKQEFLCLIAAIKENK